MSDAILSNEEVDALLNAIESGQVLVGEQVEQKVVKKIQHYDFRRPDRFPREQKRQLQKISENMAVNMGLTFSQYVRTTVDVELIAIEEFSYELFMNSFTDLVCASVVDLTPYRGNGCLTLDVGFCLAMVDRGLGGPGKAQQKLRPLTIIEESVVSQVLSNVLHSMCLCWNDVAEIDWQIVKTDMDLRSLQVAHNTESMIAINFAISGELGTGTLIFCLPVASLEAVMGKITEATLDREAEIAVIKKVLYQIPLSINTILGTTHLSFSELINLKVGDVVSLDNKITDNLSMEIDETPKFYGTPGISGKKLAMKIASVS
ncbi:MAG: flagellar motor switch protein FliM [Candidatus Kuenenia sp.]|nr:flagellar motor switch protein FliM [Candidatus Kuenenia hertensis]